MLFEYKVHKDLNFRNHFTATHSGIWEFHRGCLLQDLRVSSDDHAQILFAFGFIVSPVDACVKLGCRSLFEQMGAESAKLRVHCTVQQALVGSLEARRSSQIFNGAHPPQNSNALPPRGIARGWQSPSSAQGRSSFGQGRVGALRSLMEKLREDGVGVHGMVADLIFLRRQCDEAAVTAVLGSTLRNTVVVQAREDGARVVAEVRTAGILGQIRCDVLDEIKAKPSTGSGRGKGAGGGLSPLSESVITSNPQHFPAAEKHLRGW